jgi:hypothetical protein
LSCAGLKSGELGVVADFSQALIDKNPARSATESTARKVSFMDFGVESLGDEARPRGRAHFIKSGRERSPGRRKLTVR